MNTSMKSVQVCLTCCVLNDAKNFSAAVMSILFWKVCRRYDLRQWFASTAPCSLTAGTGGLIAMYGRARCPGSPAVVGVDSFWIDIHCVPPSFGPYVGFSLEVVNDDHSHL